MSRKSCTGSWTPTLLTGVTCAAAGRERSDDDATPAPSALAATTPRTVTLPTRIYPPCRPAEKVPIRQARSTGDRGAPESPPSCRCWLVTWTSTPALRSADGPGDGAE